MSYFGELSISRNVNLLDPHSKSWDFSIWFDEELRDLIRRHDLEEIEFLNHLQLSPELCKKGTRIASPDSDEKNFSLVVQQAAFETPVYFANFPSRTIFLSEDDRAYFSIATEPLIVMSGTFRAYEFESEIVALWVWANINSRSHLGIQRFVEGMRRRWSPTNSVPRSSYVRRLEASIRFDAAEAAKLSSRVVGGWRESNEGSASYESNLQTGKKWLLRRENPPNPSWQGQPTLGGMLSSIQAGKKVQGGTQRVGIPLFDATWISRNIVRRYVEFSPKNAVIAMPGDILIPRIGAKSNARVVEQFGLVTENCFLLKLKNQSMAAGVASFLNTSEATRQRSALSNEGTLWRSIDKTSISNMKPVFDDMDVAVFCEKLVFP